MHPQARREKAEADAAFVASKVQTLNSALAAAGVPSWRPTRVSGMISYLRNSDPRSEFKTWGTLSTDDRDEINIPIDSVDRTCTVSFENCVVSFRS